MIRIAGLMLAVLGLSACLGFDYSQVRVTPEHRAQNNRVGIVVLLDPLPVLQHQQLSVRETTTTSAALEGWNVTEVATSFLTGRLRGMGLDVKSVSYDRRDFPSPYDSSVSYPNPERMRKALAAWGAAQGLDMVVTVYRQMTKDFIEKASIQNLLGYGVIRHAATRTDAYAAIYLEAIDTARGSRIGNADGLFQVTMNDDAWREAYDVDKTPVRITGAAAAALTAPITAALTNALLLAAQEAGLSH
jgi:hypothetical protein